MGAYWSQWEHSELMSMQGFEEDLDQDEDNLEQEEEEQEHCCSGCMNCLGLSWANFI